MPLPSEVLEEIKSRIAEAQRRVASIEDVISDLRVATIDASRQEEELKTLKDEVRKLSVFYERQAKRPTE